MTCLATVIVGTQHYPATAVGPNAGEAGGDTCLREWRADGADADPKLLFLEELDGLDPMESFFTRSLLEKER